MIYTDTMERSLSKTNVVFGATGALGAAVVRRLADQGETVRAVVRDLDLAKEILPPSAGIVVADVLVPKKARAACEGATIVYHCVNVRYSLWEKLMPTITDNILDAAGKAGARLVFPGNVYGYGPFQRIPATEEHPLDATSKKGRLRNRLEQRLMQAHQAGDVPVVIPRLPDFYGPNVVNPLVGPIFRQALAGKTATWPGSLDALHDLLFIDDAANACVLLGSRKDAYGEVWHVPGAGPLTGRQFLEMVFHAAGAPPSIKAIGRFLFRFFGLLIPDAGEMTEILYQFEKPMVLDGGKFSRAFPDFRYTPHEEAVAATLEWFRREEASR
ncbi:MAG: NAD-dependent epimerase/dehydratase family protein [Sphingomonadaceae bacterium]